ncbi:hypothetical protein D3C87_1201120 [compost metagenome]
MFWSNTSATEERSASASSVSRRPMASASVGFDGTKAARTGCARLAITAFLPCRSTITFREDDDRSFAEATFLVDLVAVACFLAEAFVTVDFVAAYVTGAASMDTDTSAEVAMAVRGMLKSREIKDLDRNMICSARHLVEWR